MSLHGAIIIGENAADRPRWVSLRATQNARRFPWHVLNQPQLLSDFIVRFKPVRFAAQKCAIVYHLVAEEQDVEQWFDENTPMVSSSTELVGSC